MSEGLKRSLSPETRSKISASKKAYHAKQPPSFSKRNERILNLWQTMKQRCENPNREKYAMYGGRGIRVCDEWHDSHAFVEWALANWSGMGWRIHIPEIGNGVWMENHGGNDELEEAAKRLADLIEPCDREALLALADDMQWAVDHQDEIRSVMRDFKRGKLSEDKIVEMLVLGWEKDAKTIREAVGA